MLHLVIAETVSTHEWRKIGVEARERLCASPLVLHYSEEIHHLIAERVEVLCRCAGDFTGNTAKSLLYKLSETPAGTVTGQHGEIMDVEIGVPMRIRDLFIIDFAEPEFERINPPTEYVTVEFSLTRQSATFR